MNSIVGDFDGDGSNRVDPRALSDIEIRYADTPENPDITWDRGGYFFTVNEQTDLDIAGEISVIENKLGFGPVERAIYRLFRGFEDGSYWGIEEIAMELHLPNFIVKDILSQAFGKEKIYVNLQRNPNTRNLKEIRFVEPKVQKSSPEEIPEDEDQQEF